MGRKKRLQKKIKSWMDGYIDFSDLEFEGYSYIKSTYRKDFASALITLQNAEIIKNLIPLFNQKESFTTRIYRFVFDRKGKDTDIGSSFLLRLYCNGFTNAFKDIDRRIKKSANKLIYPSIDDCQQAIQFYISQLEDCNNCPTERSKGTTSFLDYLLDLGEQEGAIIRGLLYQQERNTGIEVTLPIEESEESKKPGRKETRIALEVMFTKNDLDRGKLLKKIELYVMSRNTAYDIALLKIALEELNYINIYEITSFRSAIQELIGDKKQIVVSRGIQNSYRSLNEYISGSENYVKNEKDNRERIDTLKKILSD